MTSCMPSVYSCGWSRWIAASLSPMILAGTRGSPLISAFSYDRTAKVYCPAASCCAATMRLCTPEGEVESGPTAKFCISVARADPALISKAQSCRFVASSMTRRMYSGGFSSCVGGGPLYEPKRACSMLRSNCERRAGGAATELGL